MSEYVLRMPKLGMQMVEGTIEEWLVADGDTVAAGQDLLVVSTDKVDTTIESPAGGAIAIAVAAGETVEVGVVLATFVA